jgi:hypothetical protein
VCDPEPKADLNENVEESNQVRLIDRNRVFEHLEISTSIFLPRRGLFLYLGIHRRTARMGHLFEHSNISMGCYFNQSVISMGR